MFIVIFVYPRALLKNGVSKSIKELRDTIKALSYPTSAPLHYDSPLSYHDVLLENTKVSASNNEELPDYVAVRVRASVFGRTLRD
jgi:hypothetical protein